LEAIFAGWSRISALVGNSGFFAMLGIPIWQVYGLTETCGMHHG
jgi:long-subunit acyl-CoA synthetase (AMP-forming)